MSGFVLKLIAVLSMLIDHVGVVFFPQYKIFRILGRLAFPIFAFLLVEGFFHTRDIKKYLYRLFSLAFISEVPFDTAFYDGFPYWNHQNVFFTLAIGLMVIYGIDNAKRSNNTLLQLLYLGSGCVFATILNCDYKFRGVLLIAIFYNFYGMIRNGQKSISQYQGDYQPLIVFLAVYFLINSSGLQIFAMLALIPIYFYNGNRGINFKYLFYAIYPIHLAIYAGIDYYVKSLGTF